MSLLDDIDEAFVDEAERLFFDQSREAADEAPPFPGDPAAQAVELNPSFVLRPHLVFLAARLAQALEDVENGIDRKLIVNMPPRMGKSTLVSVFLLVWILRKHPSWKTALVSAESTLATKWGRDIRSTVSSNPDLGIHLAPDAGAAAEWETIEHGGVLARGLKGGLVGRGAKILIIDDPHKNFAEAHSAGARDAVWNWWLADGLQRLEPPSLVIVVMTRWHQDDLVGRLLSHDKEGDPEDWEVIRFPALADHELGVDNLGREPGDPLLSPLLPNETHGQAVERWEKTKRTSGSYAFAAMHQQRPSPAKGAIFDIDWIRYWTRDPGKVDEHGKIVYFDPDEHLEDRGANWIESWDCSFKDKDDSDFVVGQRWVRLGPDRFLVAQQRARMSFTKTVAAMLAWAEDPKWTDTIRFRLVEDKANGTAVINTLKTSVPGIKPTNPTDSKISRARAVTPEFETGNVLFPHPSEVGWSVEDLIDELRNFPKGTNDDQVDALSQALTRLRSGGPAAVVTAAAMGRKVIGA